MGDRDAFVPWSCDSLTPDLCDHLKVESGSVTVRGVPIRYWKYVSSAVPEKLPIVTIHGGPAWPHNYLLPLRQLACDEGHPVYFYDQAGCGRSSTGSENVSKTHPWLLDPSYYATEELPALINHWGLTKYHVLGHSWGTIVAQLFAFEPSVNSGLQSTILSGPISDSQLYIQEQWKPGTGSLGSLPPFVQQRIQSMNTAKAFDDPEYQILDEVLTNFFTCRTIPLPQCFLDAALGINQEIYVKVQGASEFAIGGVLEFFNVTDRLHEITVPVLITSGEFDTMRPATVQNIARQIKVVDVVQFPASGHVSSIDVPGLMNEAVRDFLHNVESGQPLGRAIDPERIPIVSNRPIFYEGIICLLLTAVGVLLGYVCALKRQAKKNGRQYETIQ